MRIVVVGDTGLKDAVIAGPFQAPVLFVGRDQIPQVVVDELVRLSPDEIVVFGGTARVSDAVVSDLGLFGSVTRIAGPTVYDTAVAASQVLYPSALYTYGPGDYGDVVITDSSVTVTADPAATFTSVVLRNVDSVVLDGLTVDGVIASESTSYATNVTVRNCEAKGVYLYGTTIGSQIPSPDGWLIERNDLIGGGYGVGVFSADPAIYNPITDTTIQFNRIGNPATDAIRASWFKNLTVVGNEIFGVVETGQHADGFQTVWGGTNLVFSHNYFHDNNCQPFFVKDGYVDGIVLSENLSIRNRVGTESVGSNVWQVKDMAMFNNTFWDQSSFLFRDGSYQSQFSTGPILNIEMHHNVVSYFTPLDAATFLDPAVLEEHDNVFGKGWNWVPQNMGPNSIQDLAPQFVGWRIPGYGITWTPDDRRYGTVLGTSPDYGWWQSVTR